MREELGAFCSTKNCLSKNLELILNCPTRTNSQASFKHLTWSKMVQRFVSQVCPNVFKRFWLVLQNSIMSLGALNLFLPLNFSKKFIIVGYQRKSSFKTSSSFSFAFI